MAVTKIWSVKGTLKSVVDYAMNPDKTLNDYYTNTELQTLKDVIDYAVESEKTEMQYFVSGINCNPEFARDQMTETKKLFHKQDGIIAFHGYQSFKPGEVTPELAHEIGKELAQKLWGDRHEVIVATHLDRGHIHDHFVVNSVSMVDGKKFNACKQSYALMRKVSDDKPADAMVIALINKLLTATDASVEINRGADIVSHKYTLALKVNAIAKILK